MAEFRETVRIRARATDVARVMHDVERWPSWTASVTQATRTGSGPLAVGETVRVKQPRLVPATWTVVESTPKGFTWTSESMGVRSTGGHWAEDNGDGTSTATLVLTMEGPMAGLLTRLFDGLIRRYVRMEAEGLKKATEKG